MTLIATDLDGTIVRHDKTVGDRTVRALTRCVEQGDTVLFLTGRSPRDSMTGLPLHLLREGLMVCANGAIEYDALGDRVEHADLIDDTALIEAVALCRSLFPGGHVCIDGLERTVYDVGHPWLPPGTPATDIHDDASAVIGAGTLSPFKATYLNPEHAPARMAEAIADRLGDRIGLTFGSTTSPFFLEFTPSGVSKGTALARIARRWGFEPGEIVAFGDMPNDVPMFEVAARSYAVGDAHPLAIAAASHRAPGVDEDGVALVLEEEFLAGDALLRPS